MSMNETGLVRAAQAGDRRALDDLLSAHLPLVYNIVGRALSGHPDVDDIVQDTMLRAVRDLRSLNHPESFRLWLVTIAMRQVGTHRQRRKVVGWRTADLDEAADVPDTDADFEGLLILRLGLSGQRRQAVRATRWLDPDDRALLSLWWLEAAGQLTRTELAAALGLSVSHAGVRVQRMTKQLELCRLIVTALAASPRCPGLAAAVAGWDGSPSSVWRKRIARHVRSCPLCAKAGKGMVPTARLLVGLALVPVPLALVAAISKDALSGSLLPGLAGSVMATSGTTAKAGILSTLAHTVGAHPLAAVVTAGVLATGVVVVSPRSDAEPDRSPAVVAQAPVATTPPALSQSPPDVAPATVPLGPASLESVDRAGSFVVLVDDRGVLSQVRPNSATRRAATFEVVPGLLKPGCISLRTRDGRYLRHASWQLWPSDEEPTVLFRGDATFCPRAGTAPGSVRLESANFPGRFLRHVDGALWIDLSDDTTAFRVSSSFRVRPGLAK